MQHTGYKGNQEKPVLELLSHARGPFISKPCIIAATHERDFKSSQIVQSGKNGGKMLTS